jgi:hypothetical protein
MFSDPHKICSLLYTMLVTGIILIPTAIATPAAVQDFADMRSVITAAASSIGDENNPNRGFGFNLFGGSGQMGTADLVNNITNTILRGKFQLDTNRVRVFTSTPSNLFISTDMYQQQTSWLLPSNLANTTINGTVPTPPTLATPTLPLTASLALPTNIPTTTPTLDNLTVDLTSPYMEYVQAIPNLSNSLIALGRAFHREMNAPVNEAVAGLQQTLTTFQTALLESGFIRSQAVIPTIRASSSLETAATAWSRFLNLPGGGGSDDDAGSTSPSSPLQPSLPGSGRGIFGRAEARRPPPGNGRFYSHFELWNRSEPRPRASTDGKATPHDLVVQAEEKRVSTIAAEKARVGRPFVV